MNDVVVRQDHHNSVRHSGVQVLAGPHRLRYLKGQ